MMNQIQAVRRTLFQSINLQAVGAVALAIALLAGATRVYATNLTWTAANGTFSTASNWDPALAPVDGDRVLFTNNTSYTVSFGADSPNISRTIFSNQAGVVTLDMGTSLFTTTGRFSVGFYDTTSTVYMAGGTLKVANPDVDAKQVSLRIGDGDLPSGSVGAFIVTNGTVISQTVVLGALTNSVNSVGKLVISGPAVWTNTAEGGTITVGSGGAFSQLILTNAGKLSVLGQTRVGNGDSASNNLAIVSDPNSVWNNSQAIFVGQTGGSGNRLVVSNGAKLFSNGGTIGGGDNGSSFNTGIVVGAGSAWISTGLNFFLVGASTNNNFNDLSVYDGGLITADGSLTVNNSSPGTAISNSFHMGGVGAMSTGSFVGVKFRATSALNSITITNALFTTQGFNIPGMTNSVSILDKGTWVVANNLAADPGNTNSVTVNGVLACSLIINGGTLNNFSDTTQAGLVVGGGTLTPGNTLIVTNGGKLLTESGTIGANSSFNTGIVVGVGSVWSNIGSAASAITNIIVGTGATGSNNYLAVVNGGSLFNSGSLLIGNSRTSTVNTVVFGGPGAASTVNIQGVLFVGHNSSPTNTLTIANATVNCGAIHVGTDTTPSPNFTFTTNDITAGLVVTNFCISTNNLIVGTVLTNCISTISIGAVGNTITISSGTLTGGVVQVHSSNTIVYTSGTLGFTTLQVDGNVLGAATVNVPSGSTLQGIGSVANPVTVASGGIVAPGDSVGTLTISNNLVLNSSSVLSYEMGSTGNADKAVVVGNLTLDGVLNVTTNNTDGLFGVGNYTLITYTGTLTDNVLGIGTMPPGLSYAIVAGGGSVVLQVTAGGGGDPFVAWQTHYGLSGGNAAGTADPDGDGMSNTNEFLAGFNPTSSAAYLHVISVVRTANNITVTYLGASGDSTYTGGPASRTNVLEFTTGTANGSYSNNFASTGQTNILSGGTGLGMVSSFVDTNGATGPARYYRVRVLVP